MKFAYFEVAFADGSDEGISGGELSKRICAALGGDGPHARGDYGWEWAFHGKRHKAHAVLQKYENGWLIPVNVSFMDRVLKRGATALVDLCSAIERALGKKTKRLMRFESEREFRESGI
jgi:hypothetical protein